MWCVCVFTLCVLDAAGSAGDRLGHGEESDGAPARHHPAAGERRSSFLSFQPGSQGSLGEDSFQAVFLHLLWSYDQIHRMGN